jgi:pyroglutamyl-peptidase
LAARRRPALAGTGRVAHVFQTSYAAVEAELPGLIAHHRPDIVLLLGLAGRTPQVRVETRAQNRMSLLFPDVDGHTPARAAIRPNRGALAGRAPFRRLAAAARAARVPARISRDAGAYLCNFAYFLAITETSRRKHPALVVFVHVPMVRSARRHAMRETRQRPLMFADLVRAGEAILVALLSAARVNRPRHPSAHSQARGESRGCC